MRKGATVELDCALEHKGFPEAEAAVWLADGIRMKNQSGLRITVENAGVETDRKYTCIPFNKVRDIKLDYQPPYKYFNKSHPNNKSYSSVKCGSKLQLYNDCFLVWSIGVIFCLHIDCYSVYNNEKYFRWVKVPAPL